jgi:hypothetical protein
MKRVYKYGTREIAKACGVAPVTIRRAVNEKEFVLSDLVSVALFIVRRKLRGDTIGGYVTMKVLEGLEPRAPHAEQAKPAEPIPAKWKKPVSPMPWMPEII